MIRTSRRSGLLSCTPFVRVLGVVAAAAALIAAAGASGPFMAPPDPLSPPANGPRKADPTWHALRNATVYVNPGQVLEHATVVIRHGRIVSVQGTPRAAPGPEATGTVKTEKPKDTVSLAPEAPAGARVWDCTGLHLYAGFIDPYVEIDVPAPAADAPGLHWNPRVTPQKSAADIRVADASLSDSLRKLGYTAAAISPAGGLFRGTSALVSLAQPETDRSAPRPPVYAENAYQSVAIEGGGRGAGGGEAGAWAGYPGSKMGAIALVRQTFADADWQASTRRSGSSVQPNCLDSIAADGATNYLFNTNDELDTFRVIKIAEEFNRSAIILGSGTEFRRLEGIVDELAAPSLASVPNGVQSSSLPIIVPLNFPEAPKVGTVGQADAVPLRELMTWEQAPTNPRRLEQAGLHVSLTTSKLRDRSKFRENLRKAIAHGLTEEQALAMLTTRPAELLGASQRMGSIEEGKIANLLIADGAIFAEKTQIRDVWVDGKRHEVNAAPSNLKGEWEITLTPPPKAPEGSTVRISWSIDKNNGVTIRKSVKEGDGAAKVSKATARNVRVESAVYGVDGRVGAPARISFVVDHEPLGAPGVFTLAGVVDGESMIGDGVRADGTRYVWAAKRISDEPAEDPKPTSGAKGDGEQAAKPADAVTGDWSGTVLVTQTGESIPFSMKLAMANNVVTGTAASHMGEHPISEGMFTASGEGTGKLTFKVTPPEGAPLTFTLDVANNSLKGRGTDGTMQIDLDAARTLPPAAAAKETDDAGDTSKDVPESYGYPFGPFAVNEVPAQQSVMFTNATIWTSGPQGVIQNGVMVIQGGRIVAVGDAASVGGYGSDFTTIDLQGKHITPGLIDCHSHTGISNGVNEAGQAVTAEVRIQDVTDPDAMSWYYQLGGGITTVNNLHGSANPIGGQNAVNKNRWGVRKPDELHFQGATPGIKFALGENVKRSSGSSNDRYPNTRMGVDTLMRDRFTAAKEYAAALNSATPPRRDLELECLAEILAGTRLIHCHSYRQDEILMLCRIADDFGFKLGTFQHILEGYKVADEVRDHAIGASAFSDWWAYKVEVQDAIPYAGAIMHDVGVCVSFNSDSDELARRMNVEAGKAVKYGGIAPAEALKFVTINPAKQLRIDDRVGSIEVGKDADFAIWSAPVMGKKAGDAITVDGTPMSSMARCEQTWVDGRCYFSIEKDAEMRRKNAAERSRLIQKLLASGSKRPSAGGSEGSGSDGGGASPGGRRRGPRPTEDGLTSGMHAADEEEAPAMPLLQSMLRRAADQRREEYMQMWRLGIDPTYSRCGDCGESMGGAQ